MNTEDVNFRIRMDALIAEVQRVADALEQEKQTELPRSIGKVFADADDNILEDEEDGTSARRVLQRLLSSLQQQHGDLRTTHDITRRYTPLGLQVYLTKFAAGSDADRQRALDALILVGLWDE